MEDIVLPSFTLVSLYHTNSVILGYLKKLNHEESITEYLPDLSVYIGRKNAYFVQKNEEFVGFLYLASTIKEQEYELFFAIDEEHQHQHIMTSLLREVTFYLFTMTSCKKLLITPMNPYSKKIAIQNDFKTIDDFHYFKENDFQNKL